MSTDGHSMPGRWLAAIGGVVALVTLLLLLPIVLVFGMFSGGEDSVDRQVNAVAIPAIMRLSQQTLDEKPLEVGGRTRWGINISAAFDASKGWLEVEVKRVGQAWSGAVDASKLLHPDGSASLFVYRAAGEYRWRARTGSMAGGASEWREFGKNGDQADFVLGIPVEVGIESGGEETSRGKAGMNQYDAHGRSLPVGGRTEGPVWIAGEQLAREVSRFEVEIKPIGEPFDGKGFDSKMVDEEGRAAMSLALADGRYRWRGRPVLSEGSTGAWVEFGRNPDGEADFEVAGSSSKPAARKEEKSHDDAHKPGSGGVSSMSSSSGGPNEPLPSSIIDQPPLWESLTGPTLLVASILALVAAIGATAWASRKT